MPRRKPIPPSKGPSGSAEPRGLRELDRFTEASLHKWSILSKDLDELHDVLFFSLEPERRRLRSELIASLDAGVPIALQMQRWVRIVTYQYSHTPLSCAGSLQSYGGRFNVGVDVEESTLNPWSALYLAQDFETAFREKFALSSNETVNGLTPQELALEHGTSHSTVFVLGSLSRLFDIRDQVALRPLASILRKIEMPARARQLMKKLQIPSHALHMANNAKRIHDTVSKHNWRMWPVQFGLPAPSHILADLVRQAGYEGIIYRSSKGPGDCVALFPDQLASASFVELADAGPPQVAHSRLDELTASKLNGWDSVDSAKRLR